MKISSYSQRAFEYNVQNCGMKSFHRCGSHFELIMVWTAVAKKVSMHRNQSGKGERGKNTQGWAYTSKENWHSKWNEKDQSFTLEFARDGFLYSVFQVESKFEVMVFVKVGKPSNQCREQPTNSTHSQKKEESTGLAYRAISARALRHLTLISRKQVTRTISRVCVVAVLVAVAVAVLVAFCRIWEIFVIACVFQFSRI